MTKAETRAAMPQCTQFIDDFRNVFEDIPRGIAVENGHTVRWPKTYAPGTGVAMEKKAFSK